MKKMVVNRYFLNAVALVWLLCGGTLPAVQAALQAVNESVIEQIEFRDVTVGDALKILSEQSGLNIIASKQAAEIPVTMYLRRVTAMEVIEALAKTYNLWFRHDELSNIIRIYTIKEYRLEQVEFKREETEIFTMKNAKNALDLAETVQNLFFDRVILNYGRNQNELIMDLSQRFQRFNMIDSQTTLGTNRGGGGGAGGGQFGGGQFGGGQQGNQFGGNQFGGGQFGQGQGMGRGQGRGGQSNLQEQLSTAADVLERLGRGREGDETLSSLLTGDAAASRQVLEQTSRRQAPIYVGVIKHQNRVLVRTRDKDAMEEIRRLYRQLDTESSMLLMEVKILSVDLSDGYDSLFDFKIKQGDVNVSTLQATNALNSAINTAAAVFDPALLATVVSEKFEMRLQLLEKEGRVTELATPMLMTTNQEVSRVFVGEERPIVSGYSASSTSNNVPVPGSSTVVQPILVPETDTRAIGTTLLLTPNINADRTVTIQILVEQSTIADGQATIPVQVADALVDARIDLVQERTFSGTVVAKDSTSVAVGGLIEEAARSRENKVPVLGDLPVFGFFFREEAQASERRELVIVIKPHIIGTPAEAEQISRQHLSANSVHPNALEADNMDVYSNPNRQHKGYVLEAPYQQYPKQDATDPYRGRGAAADFPGREVQASAQQVYMDLTRYAAESIRQLPDQRPPHAKIHPAELRQRAPLMLLPNPSMRMLPVESWRQGGVYVTALEVRNASPQAVVIDQRQLKGHWLAATLEGNQLAKQGDFGDSTYLYLISGEPFDDIVARLPGGGG